MKTPILILARPVVAGWVFTAGAVADILTTAPQVHNEANPIASWVFDELGFWPGAILMKLAVALAFGALAYARNYPDWFRAFVYDLAGLVWLYAAIHNLNNL